MPLFLILIQKLLDCYPPSTQLFDLFIQIFDFFKCNPNCLRLRDEFKLCILLRPILFRLADLLRILHRVTRFVGPVTLVNDTLQFKCLFQPKVYLLKSLAEVDRKRFASLNELVEIFQRAFFRLHFACFLEPVV